MKNPVKTKYGHHYEKLEIINWIKKSGTCPQSRNSLTLDDIEEDPEFKQEIESYLT